MPLFNSIPTDVSILVSPVATDWKRDRKLVLLSILTKFGQWDDLIISQLQAIFQLFSSYPPSPRESFVKLANLVCKPP